MSETLAMYQDKKVREAFTAKAMEVYGRHKGRLEPARNGEIIAIEPETGDHVVGRTLGKADKAMFALHPDKWVLFVRVGEADRQIALKTW